MIRILIRQGSLLNPFIQALPFALLIIFLIPDIFNKYETNVDRSYYSSEKHIEKFIEFDANEYGELAILDNVNNIVAPVPLLAPLPTAYIYNHNNEPSFVIVLHHPWVDKNNLFSADVNHNGKDEIYVFTKFQDSLFIESFEHYSTDSLISRSRVIEVADHKNGFRDVRIQHIGCTDLNNDGSDEFIFTVRNEGVNQPGRVFAWDISKDTLLKSPIFGISMDTEQNYLCDVDDDGLTEIVFSTTSNMSLYGQTPSLPYPDTSSYVLVLDNDLEFLFEPVPVRSKHLSAVPIQTKQGVLIYTLSNHSNNGNQQQEIRVYNLDGQFLRSKMVSNRIAFENDWIFTANNGIDDKFYFAHTRGMIEMYDSDLGLQDNWEIKEFYGHPLKPMDLDNDGENEFIFRTPVKGIHSNSFLILKNDLSNPVNITLGGAINEVSKLRISNKGNDGSFIIQLNDKDVYICSYQMNPTYKFKYFLWILIYGLLVVFISLIQWAQRIKTQHRINTEKELAKYQLIAIKNQIDPHFTLNTLNTISALYGKGENQEAYKYMTKLSRLMLQVLNNSDQISSTLKTEMEMLKSYIDLQMIRFRDVFTYSINWDEEKLSDREVPRMLIHLFVENAIKHGLRLKKENGILKIDIQEEGKYLYIIIEDNGVGRKAASLDKSLSSGKGLEISDKICEMYYRLKNVRVSYSIEDLMDIKTALGTKVRITVHPKLFKL